MHFHSPSKPWGKVDFTAICDCLSGAPFRPKYGDGGLCLREINKSSALLHERVCVTVADGGLPQTIQWKNGARFPNISSLIKAGGSRSRLQAEQTNTERKTGSVMFVVRDGAPGGGGLCAAVLHPGANGFAT